MEDDLCGTCGGCGFEDRFFRGKVLYRPKPCGDCGSTGRTAKNGTNAIPGVTTATITET